MNRLSATGFALCDEQSRLSPLACTPSITSPRWRALPPAFAGCSFSNGTRKTNAAFCVACFSFVLALLSFDHEPALARSSACFAGCSFSNGTRKTNAAFSVACFSFVLIIYHNRLEREYRIRYDFQADPNMVLQFTRGFLGADSMLACEAAPRKLRRERHFMSKRSCETAENIEGTLLQMK